MRLEETAIPGCFMVHAENHRDERGTLAKTYHAGVCAAAGLPLTIAEQFHSWSRRGVLRGMHLQGPPAHGTKLVVCLVGEVLDAVLDLRRGSPAYGRHATAELLGERCDGVLIPGGVAHGFYVTAESALLTYSCSYAHDSQLDIGVRWDSAGIPWPVSDPILSARDKALPALSEFESPFAFGPADDCGGGGR